VKNNLSGVVVIAGHSFSKKEGHNEDSEEQEHGGQRRAS